MITRFGKWMSQQLSIMETLQSVYIWHNLMVAFVIDKSMKYENYRYPFLDSNKLQEIIIFV